MIVVDTNVWSEPIRKEPEPAVVAWLTAHRDEVAITTVTIGELLYGLALLPDGRRKDGLGQQIERLIASAEARTCPYDVAAARAFAAIKAKRRQAGCEVTKPEDAMIAAIAASRGCAVATRNVHDFEAMGVELINPWYD